MPSAVLTPVIGASGIGATEFAVRGVLPAVAHSTACMRPAARSAARTSAADA
jgi:predicted MFS family arabinose efflux permease